MTPISVLSLSALFSVTINRTGPTPDRK